MAKAPPKKPAAKKKAPAKKPAKKPKTKQQLSDKAKEFIDKKAGKKGQAKEPDAKHNEETELFNWMVEHFDELKDLQKDISKLTGEMGSLIKRMLTERKLNRDAMQTIRRIEGKTPTDRADFLRTFIPMLDAWMKVGGWKTELTDLVSMAEAEGDEADISGEGQPAFEDVDTDAEQGKAKAAEASDAEEADLSQEGPQS